jgi:hypothetical protein
MQMKVVPLPLVLVPILAACASDAETAALNAGAYQRCVSEAEIIAADPAAECGPNAESFRPSFGQKFRYLYNEQLAQQTLQAQQQRQAAPPLRPVQAADRGAIINRCVAAMTPSTTQTGRFGEYLANVQQARAYCEATGGIPAPPQPPPVIIRQPEQPQRVDCVQIGYMVRCNVR